MRIFTRHLHLMAVLLFTPVLHAAEIRVPHRLCNVTIEYSPKVITAEHLLQVVRLHPEYAKSYATRTPMLDLCTPNKKYRPCGQRDLTDPNFLANAKVNLAESRSALRELNVLTPPKELSALKTYYLAELTFYILLAERQLSFYETGDKKVLMGRIANIDPATTCGGILTRIYKIEDANMRFPLIANEYNNCLNNRFRADLGSAPLAAWEIFKKTYGLKENFECY